MSFANTIEAVLNMWERITILLYNVVKEIVVNTHSLASSFQNKED